MGKITIGNSGNLLLRMLSTSLIAAPEGEVITPIFFGSFGICNFFSLSNNPSLNNFCFNSSYFLFKSPSPAVSIFSIMN